MRGRTKIEGGGRREEGGKGEKRNEKNREKRDAFRFVSNSRCGCNSVSLSPHARKLGAAKAVPPRVLRYATLRYSTLSKTTQQCNKTDVVCYNVRRTRRVIRYAFHDALANVDSIYKIGKILFDKCRDIYIFELIESTIS